MIDNNRLIRAWKIFRDSNPYELCNGREFQAIKDPEYCMGKMIEDTITLLKDVDMRSEHTDKQRIINFMLKIIPDDFVCGHIALTFNDDGSLFITVNNKDE